MRGIIAPLPRRSCGTCNYIPLPRNTAISNLLPTGIIYFRVKFITSMPVSLLVLLRAVEPPRWQTLKVEQTGKDGIEGQQSGAEDAGAFPAPLHCFFFIAGGSFSAHREQPFCGLMGCKVNLLPEPPLPVVGLRCWLSALAERVVTANHDFQVAGLCKPSPHDSRCLLATFLSAELGKEHRCALVHSRTLMQRTANWSKHRACYRKKKKPVYF